MAQRGQLERQAGQAVKKVFPERAFGDQRGQVAVGGADDVQIDLDSRFGAERHHFTFRQHAQQTGLQRARHVADLVEEQRAGAGLFEAAAHALGSGAGEGAGAVTEQGAFDQRLGDGGAVDRDERAVRTPAAEMNRSRQHFLAGARLAGQQNRNVAVHDSGNLADDSNHLRIPAGQRREAGAGGCGPCAHLPWRLERTRLNGCGRPPRCLDGCEVADAGPRGVQQQRGVAFAGEPRDVLRIDVEHGVDRFIQHAAGRIGAQFGQCAAIRADDAPAVIQCQQVFGLHVQKLPRPIEVQHPMVAVFVQEVRVLDQCGVGARQLHDQRLAAPIIGRAHRRDIQYAEHLPSRAEYRHGRAGEIDVRDTKVV